MTQEEKAEPQTQKKDVLTMDEQLDYIRENFLSGGKLREFQPGVGQREIMESILRGEDTLCVLPTGSGKSLCFQAPAVFLDGITLVVTPLVSLIEDQVRQFNVRYRDPLSDGLRYRAIAPGSGLSLRDMLEKLSGSEESDLRYQLLYVSPERLSHPKFLRLIREFEEREEYPLRIRHIVLDECHCLSQWGFQFRESYLEIRQFVMEHRRSAFLSAFTATATMRDIHQIRLVLGMKHPREFICFRPRTELYPIVLRCREELGAKAAKQRAELEQQRKNAGIEADPPKEYPLRITRLLNLLRDFLDIKYQNLRPTDKCIIYCTTVEQVEFLHKKLVQYGYGEQTTVYHAGLNTYMRRRNARRFRESYRSERIILATKAFGMGIDDEYIRLVIHYDCPRSIEEYYQEIGRAGRDIERTPAVCVLLYTHGEKHINPGSLNHMIRWVGEDRDPIARQTQPIASRFSEEAMELAYYRNYERLARMMDYCEAMAELDVDFRYQDFRRWILLPKLHADEVKEPTERSLAALPPLARRKHAQRFKLAAAANKASRRIAEYFGGESEDPSLVDRLNDYVCGQVMTLAGNQGRRAFLNKVQIDRTAIERIDENAVDRELLKILKSPHVLHINNTGLANTLRWHPEQVVLNRMSEELVLEEYKNPEIREGFSTILSRNIRENSAFVHVEHVLLPGVKKIVDREALAKINAAWDHRTAEEDRPLPEAAYLYAVDPGAQIIRAVFVRDAFDEQWIEPEEESELEPWIRRQGEEPGRPEISVKALFSLTGHGDWRRQKDLPDFREQQEFPANRYFAYAEGRRSTRVSFGIYGKEKLTYFDLMVLDAVYSIQQAGEQIIYPKAIWEILTGDPKVRFPRSMEASGAGRAILESIERMMQTKITIEDRGFRVREETFLPLKKRRSCEKGYDCVRQENGEIVTPPLFRYAERKNGEIVRVPVNLMNIEKIRDGFVSDSLTQFNGAKTAGIDAKKFRPRSIYLDGCAMVPLSRDTGRAMAVDAKTRPKQIFFPEADQKNTYILTAESGEYDYRDVTVCRKAKGGGAVLTVKAPAVKPLRNSVYHSVLCHYLLHRIAIARKSQRGRYLSVETLARILENYAGKHDPEDPEWFRKGVRNEPLRYLSEVIYVLQHYQRLEYVEFYGYVRKMDFTLAQPYDLRITERLDAEEGEEIEPEYCDRFSSTAFFRFRTEPCLTCWREDGTYYIQYQSKIPIWNYKANARMKVEGSPLSALAKRERWIRRFRMEEERVCGKLDQAGDNAEEIEAVQRELEEMRHKYQLLEEDGIFEVDEETMDRLTRVELTDLDGFAFV